MKKTYIKPVTVESVPFMGPLMEMTVSKWAVDGNQKDIIEDDPDDIDARLREEGYDLWSEQDRMSLW